MRSRSSISFSLMRCSRVWSLILIVMIARDYFSSNHAMAKDSAGGVQGLTPREIFRKTAGQWGGDIFLLPKRYNYMLESWEFDPKGWYPSSVHGKLLPPHPVSMHGVAWDYDLRIPLVFFDPSGRWFKAGVYNKLAVQQDIVPTLAHILDVPAPAKRGGRVLSCSFYPHAALLLIGQ